jgi:hypothetical protein
LTGNQFTYAPTFRYWIVGIAVDEVERSGLYALDNSFLQVVPKTGRMVPGQTNVLIKMKEGNLAPLNSGLDHQRIEKFKLRSASGRD